jgi:hypothetical protein
MAERSNHEFLNPLRRADEARIARAIKPAQRVHDEAAARAQRLEERAARDQRRATVPASRPAETRNAPRAAVPDTRRNPRQGQARGRRPGWVVLLAIITMAAGFAGALYYLGSADLGNSNDSPGPASLEDWELKGK